ncbi:WW domain-containing oxidoreductase [Colletotrichum phormii]|uniref:WW domain-containing oxidoreductase n=1 Tax=Colletotrichum phormii TaxID=359342 RepID=A0AAJ0EET0_9PEZI|nr:WW domain-containing oxidoreductase [Colletotrichum phormii]KAK1637402.1 WW domain-containing oxidoreductase [Colletotrichum phormii]
MSRYAEAHQNPKGPGDARPTALQIIQDEDLIGKLTGKTILITGANQGIGLETARALYQTGATIFLGVRSREKGERAIADITAFTKTKPSGSLEIVEMSLDDFSSVRKGAQDFLSKSNNGKLNILINNAGIMAQTKTKTVDGFESQFATNHLGHFLLFRLLKPALLASATPAFSSRVVAVSSMAHRASDIRFDDVNFDEEGSYEPYTAYGQSKTANIYFSDEIERRYGASRGLHSTSLHPGAILTSMAASQNVDVEAAKANLGEEKFNQLMGLLKNPEQGAATTVYAAVSKEWENKGGKYLNDCAEGGPGVEGFTPASMDPGYAPWAYDEEKAARSWRESCKMVGVEDDA